MSQDVDATPLELRGLRVLVFVDHVLAEALSHQLLGLWLHPGGDEGSQVEPRVAVEDQLVFDQCECNGRVHGLSRQPVPGDRVLDPAVERVEVQHGGSVGLVDLGVKRHGVDPFRN